MRLRWAALSLLLLATPVVAQQANVYWQTQATGVNRFSPVSTPNPLPVTVVGGGGGAVTIADCANVTQGCEADARSTATDTTPITVVSILKQISFSIQAAVTALGSPFQAGGSIGNTSFGAMLNATPSIANGNGVVITPTTEASTSVAPSTAVATAESCRVLQASATNVYSVTVAIAATTGYVMIFNAASAPVDGAVSPAWPAIRVVSDGTSGWAALQFNPPLRLATGATVCFSSTGPFTKTASATAAIGGQVK